MKSHRILWGLMCILPSPSAFTQWVQVAGFTARYISAFAVVDTDLIAGSTGGGVFLSTDRGSTWGPIDSGLTTPVVYAFAESGTSLLAATDSGVFVSTNRGGKWTSVNNGLTTNWVISLAASGPNLFAGTVNSGVFLSTNNGASWVANNDGITQGTIFAFEVAGTSIYAGAERGNIFRRKFADSNWTSANTGLVSLASVDAFAVSGTYIFAGTGGSSASFWAGDVFRSTDSGTTWMTADSGFTNTFLNSFDAFAISGDNLFVGISTGGVYLSTNNGASWTGENDSLTAINVSALAVSGEYLFAGTWGSTVWRRPLSDMVTSANSLSYDLPSHFALYQNYPNPFNPSTTIYYQVPVNSKVKIVVYDVLGREVKTLVDEVKEVGYHSVTFEAIRVASGTYICRMIADPVGGGKGYVQVKKMMVLK